VASSSYSEIVPVVLRSENINLSFPWYRAALNGQTSWDGAFRLKDELLDYSPAVVVLDHAANNLDSDIYKFQIEGSIRRIRAQCPSAKIIMAIFGRFSDPATNDHAEERPNVTAFMRSIASNYGITVLDLADLVVNSSEPMTTWYSSPDGVHPDTDGHSIFGNLLADIVTPSFLGASQWTGNIADYDYVNEESINFEGAGIERLGTDNDGETGLGWSTSGTSRISASADDTIKWVGIFSSFGIDAAVGVSQGVIAWDIDGGGYTNIDLSTRVVNPYLIGGYLGDQTEHTVTLKVISGSVTVNRFLAI